MSEDNLSPPDDLVDELTTRASTSHRKNLCESQSIFQLFDFILPNGDPSIYKIECDHLTDEDIECFAKMVSHVSFKSVEGIPRGGVLFAKALEKYIDPESEVHLVVDDVLASGKSMTDAMQAAFDGGEEVVRGVVIFSRGPKINNCVPIFQMHPFWSEL
jgi:adenine/guanine phosphoribosyltransferase-like PRPP-binding protein